MSSISKLTDYSVLSDQHISFHDVCVKAHHVEVENVLGSDWYPSGDDKCKTIWDFMFHDDNGESFPVSLYDWNEYDDYYRFTNHYYHIATRTPLQSKLVADYIESKILDYMKIVRSQFYFDKQEMVKKIREAIQTYYICHSDSEVSGATIQIYNDGKIEIGRDVKIDARNVFEPVVMLLNHEAVCHGMLECDLNKIKQLVDSISSYFYYQYLNSIQANWEPES